jgi:protein MpaA
MSESPKSIARTLPSLRHLRRLGKNVGGYFGETIDIASVLTDCAAAARAHAWTIEEIPAGPKPALLAFTRQGASSDVESAHASRITHHASVTPQPPGTALSRPRVYLSAGIHGDEPAGPLAMRQLLQEDGWLAGLDLWLCPCLNPTGFLVKRRENAEGIDLNRHYLQPRAEETVAHIGWLQRQPAFDVCLCLHEDWESHGFYVYELNPENRPSLAEHIIERVADVCPIDRSETIEGRPAQAGVIRPNLDPRTRPEWPESFFLLTHKTRLSYTLEAPSDFPLSARVAALVTAVKAAGNVMRDT